MERFRLLHGGQSRQRSAERRPVQVSGQIVWKDARGTTRLSRVVTRDVSESGVAVDCINGSTIPLYRLVYFQVDRSERNNLALPEALRRNAVLAAVFRVGETDGATGAPGSYALRLLIEPQVHSAARPHRLEAVAEPIPAAV
jgi:uncharacterized protein (UPF0248 family)